MTETARALLAVLLLQVCATAQERRTTGQAGGPLVLFHEAFELSPSDQLAFLGPRTGTRLVLSIAGATAADPLSGSELAAQAVRLDPEQRDTLDWTRLVARLEHSAVIELLEGRWVDWWKLGAIDSRATPLALGLREAHRRGVPIVATGSAARYVCASSIVPYAEVGRAQANPRRTDPFAALEGLGLAELTLDTTTAAGDSIERLLRVLLRGGIDEAALLHGRAALVLDERAGTTFVRAPAGEVWWIDARDARRQRERIAGGRISRARDGSRWNGTRPASVSLVRGLAPREDVAAPRPRTPAAVEDPFQRASWQRWTTLTPWTDRQPLVLRGQRSELTLWLDEDTAWEPDAQPDPALVRLRFDACWSFPDPAR